MLPHTLLLLVIGVNSLALSMLLGVAPLWQPHVPALPHARPQMLEEWLALRQLSSKVWACVCQAPRGQQAREPWLKISSGFCPLGECVSAVDLSGQCIWWGIWVRSCLNLAARGWRWTAEPAAWSKELGGWGGLCPAGRGSGGQCPLPHLLPFFHTCYHFLRCKELLLIAVLNRPSAASPHWAIKWINLPIGDHKFEFSRFLKK